MMAGCSGARSSTPEVSSEEIIWSDALVQSWMLIWSRETTVSGPFESTYLASVLSQPVKKSETGSTAAAKSAEDRRGYFMCGKG